MKVLAREQVGVISDQLIAMGVEIGEYSWGTNHDELNEDILEKGVEMAKAMCEALG